MKDTQYQSQLQMVKNKHEKIRKLIAMQLERVALKLVHDLPQDSEKLSAETGEVHFLIDIY